MKAFGKIFVGIIGCLVGLILIALLSLNIAKYFIYSDYYEMKSDVCKNPGLSDGFVCQGITSAEDEYILVSGYMKDDGPSRIYITNENNESYYVTVNIDSAVYIGHAGGIAYHEGTVYLVSDDAIHVLSFEDIKNAENGSAVEVLKAVPVNNEGSFAFAGEEHLYVGEFHDGEAYVTNHEYETPSGTNYAIVSRYTYDDLENPERIYSIPNKVQGMALTPDGKIMLSTSYGLKDSYFYLYDESETYASEHTLDGAPVYFLGECERTVKAPAMAEGLALHKGKVITLFESASDKYIFGKFFFANKIVAFEH